jgi:polar amino acid transport system permease protein
VFEDQVAVIRSVMPFLLWGLWQTFKISIIAIAAGSLLGYALGTLRSLRVPGLTGLIGFYLHIFRGSPFLVQLYVFYYVFPQLGVAWLQWDSFTASIVTLSLYTGSYVTEIVNGAILAVPKAQDEAARSLGMSKAESLWYVVLPQALRLTIPPMSGVYVIIIKSTAILSVVGLTELTRQGEISILRFPADILLIYALVALLYFVYCYPVLRFADWAEKRVGGPKAPTE